MAWPIPQGGTAILSTWPEALARAARSSQSDEHVSIIQDTSLTRVKSSYEQSASSHIGSCAQSPRAHTNKPAAARKQRTRHGGAAHTARAAQLRGKHNTHCAHTPRSIHGARRARAPSTSWYEHNGTRAGNSLPNLPHISRAFTEKQISQIKHKITENIRKLHAIQFKNAVFKWFSEET